jgi:hypothetical protein
MKTLLLVIIVLLGQVGCVTRVTSTTDGKEYYKVTIPFTLDLTPTGIAREVNNVYRHTQETTTTYSDTMMTREQINAGIRDCIVENIPAGVVRDALDVYSVAKIALSPSEPVEEIPVEVRLAAIEDDKSFSGLIERLKIIWSDPYNIKK